MRFEKDAYLRKLMIMDHLVECLVLYVLYKLKMRTWGDVQRELADLCIILGAELEPELVKARIERFQEKERGEENHA